MKAFACWSGGKESALALYRAEFEGIEVAYLLNMVSEDGRHSRTHGIDAKLLRCQAEAMDIPLIQEKSSWENYEEKFKKVVSEMKGKGIEAGVFGDIDLQEHRDWVERVSKETKIKAYLPLWGQDQRKIMREFIEAGFEATVVSVKASSLGREWLGRRIDVDFLKRLSYESITPCGEVGEYHTFITYGPLFKKGIEITKSRRRHRKGQWFLDILEWKIV